MQSDHGVAVHGTITSLLENCCVCQQGDADTSPSALSLAFFCNAANTSSALSRFLAWSVRPVKFKWVNTEAILGDFTQAYSTELVNKQS